VKSIEQNLKKDEKLKKMQKSFIFEIKLLIMKNHINSKKEKYFD
jgi:hypothetical protein